MRQVKTWEERCSWKEGGRRQSCSIAQLMMQIQENTRERKRSGIRNSVLASVSAMILSTVDVALTWVVDQG